MSSRNYRIMKFFETVDNNANTAKGYVKIDMRGSKGKITINTENIIGPQATSDVYLLKDRNQKLKVGSLNSKKGMIQKNIVVAPADEPFEDYNVCAVVNDKRIVLYTPLYNMVSKAQIPYLTQTISDEIEIEEEPWVAPDVEPKVETTEEVYDNVDEKPEDNNPEDDSNAEETIDDLEEYKKAIIKELGTDWDLLGELKENEVNEIGPDTPADNNDDSTDEVRMTKEEVEKLDQKINALAAKLRKEKEIEDEAIALGRAKRHYRNEFEKNLYNLLSEFESIDPLAYNIKGMKWWKIPFDENSIYKGFLPYFNQIVSTYYPYPLSNRVTTCQGLMKNYGYYLFGIYEEDDKMNKFVYGIPGRFIRDDQPYRGVTGFKNWSYKSQSIPGDYGFWLAFIDSNSGNIVDPPAIDE